MAEGDLCEISDVLGWLNMPTDTSGGVLTGLITAASRWVSNYCGRQTFLSATYTDTYDGTGQRWMLLRQWPVTALKSITVGLDYQQTLSDPTTFILEQPLPSGGNQRLTLLATSGMCVFPRGRSNVAVNYTAGFETAPPDVAQAVIELVGERYKARDRIGQVSKSLGGQETTAFSQRDMNASIVGMLSPYRRLIPC